MSVHVVAWEQDTGTHDAEVTHRQRQNHVRAKDSGTNHVHVKLWLTIYKLTGWLASLDLRQPHTRRILSHRTASPHAFYDVLVWDGGRGKTINDLVGQSLFVCLFVCLFGTL